MDRTPASTAAATLLGLGAAALLLAMFAPWAETGSSWSGFGTSTSSEATATLFWLHTESSGSALGFSGTDRDAESWYSDDAEDAVGGDGVGPIRTGIPLIAIGALLALAALVVAAVGSVGAAGGLGAGAALVSILGTALFTRGVNDALDGPGWMLGLYAAAIGCLLVLVGAVVGLLPGAQRQGSAGAT